MKYQFATTAGLLLADQALAAPLQARDNPSAADIVLKIAPDSKTCADTTECRTAEEAGPLLAAAMAQYGLDSAGQIAAVLALTALESVQYKYKHNVSPGRPGQGTSNMQMYSYNLEYAMSIPELKDQAAQYSADETDATKQNALLALVQDDKYNFGSGPWFLSTKCADAKDALSAGKDLDAGFQAYMTCVGVTIDSERQAFWDSAKAAFGLN
ncbi:hypothetical protein GGR53DRAFT_131323 [Hypoxylon sp. FL1150]|nr:hypothetical protein GGR53DRAFT_131323 [Hypoxylon sp. FL1150]